MTLATMVRVLLCVLALCAFGASSRPNEVDKTDPIVTLNRQLQLLDLFQHISEPSTSQIIQLDAKKWSIEGNIEKYTNVTAAQTYAGMLKNGWHLPRGAPFSVYEPAHAFEAMTLFNVLYSAKDYDTFYYTAAYLRDIVNEGLYVYVVSIAIIYRHDTQYIALPPIYEVLPSFFNNAEIMTTAQRINTHGPRHVKDYPSTYVSGEDIIIKANATFWSYLDNNDHNALSYFTNDYELNAAQYFLSLVTPYWLGGNDPSVIYKDRRGEAYWFAHRQLVARYYMERLSNGLGEIPDITDVVEAGYTPGLLYSNGIPFPSRPNHFRLDQPELSNTVEKVKEFEQRIVDAIDKGFYVNRKGEQVSLLNDGGLDILGRLIESNADSPNRYYYKDFIRLWKQILGNTVKTEYKYVNRFTPLVVPSALENFETSLRDPAFYMLWKRILNLFVSWQKQMPLHKPEDMSLPGVSIEKVEVDKLVTFFENSYLNVTSYLFQNEEEEKNLYEDTSVLVEYPRLNHKPFNVRVNVKSEAAKKVLVKFFLAPKYDSNGFEIPLQKNTQNFFLLDQFTSDLKEGENVITRASDDFHYTSKKSLTSYDISKKIEAGDFLPAPRSMSVFPHNLLLPKGSVGGQVYQIIAYIDEPKIPGARTTGYPADRPLYSFQVKNVTNLYFQDVNIYHE